MLQGIFNYDNPVWRFIGKLGDLMIERIEAKRAALGI